MAHEITATSSVDGVKYLTVALYLATYLNGKNEDSQQYRSEHADDQCLQKFFAK
jgi:hypothetical protein